MDKTVLHKESTLRGMRLVYKTVEIDKSCALAKGPRSRKDNGSGGKTRMTKSVREFSPRSRKMLNLFHFVKENRQYLYLRYMVKDHMKIQEHPRLCWSVTEVSGLDRLFNAWLLMI